MSKDKFEKCCLFQTKFTLNLSPGCLLFLWSKQWTSAKTHCSTWWEVHTYIDQLHSQSTACGSGHSFRTDQPAL